MALFNRDCRGNCTDVSIVVSIIVGIITAFLQLTAVITVTPAFLWVVFGIAVGYLAVTLIAAALTQDSGVSLCSCSALPALLIGILGTALLAVVLLAIDFAATSIVGAIVTGALLLFFTQTLTTTACLVRCIARCRD